MQRLSPSKISATRIPKITDLRDELNYGDTKVARCAAFSDDLRVFRRRYSAAGIRGPDLIDWNSSKHQDALRQMTLSFLDENGYGEIYWPSDPTSPNFNSLQYSEHRTFITQMVRQLIFRLNLQQYRNNKYKKKEHQPDARPHEIIDLEAEVSPTDNLPSQHDMQPLTSPMTISSTESNPRVSDTCSSKGLQSPDVSGFPANPEHDPEHRPRKRKMKVSRLQQPAKRSRIVTFKIPATTGSLADPRQTAQNTNQKSLRPRRRVPRTGCAGLGGLDQAIVSQRGTDESLSVCDHDIGSDLQTNIRQISESVERASNLIRSIQPSVTSEPTTPSLGQTKPTPDSYIDPNLEQLLSPSSTIHQSRSDRTSSASSIMNLNNEVQNDAQLFRSPASTISTLPSTHETTLQTSLTVNPNVQSSQDQKSSSAASATPVLAASSAQKSNLNFDYIVILSRAPLYSHTAWTPKGHFMEKSLSELINELPFKSKNDITGLTIRLKGPGLAIKEIVYCGEEAKFGNAKNRFLRMIKMGFKNHNKLNAGQTLVLCFEIEAVREGGIEEVDDDDYGEEDDDDILF